MEILTIGHPLLSQKMKPVTDYGTALEKIAHDMMETMVFYEGIGLAANQVGYDQQILVIHEKLISEDKNFLVITNPVVELREGSLRREEGCLSVPGIYAEVTRPAQIQIRYQDISGKEQILEAESLLARVILHENDHLNGVLFVERLPKIKQKLLQPRLKKLSR